MQSYISMFYESIVLCPSLLHSHREEHPFDTCLALLTYLYILPLFQEMGSFYMYVSLSNIHGRTLF